MQVALPPNFGRAVDLSSLGKPKVETTGPAFGVEVTASNLTETFLTLSLTKPVVIICWSLRSADSLEMVNTLGKLEQSDQGAWLLGRVDIDAQPEVAKALQVRSVPFALALIGEQMVPLFEAKYTESQVRLVIDKVLTLAAEQGVGSAPIDSVEPEEDEAMSALEAGNFALAETAYNKLLARKPNDSLAKLGLAQTQLLMRTENLDPIVIREMAASAPDDIALQLQAADLEIVSGSVELAFTRLLALIRGNTGDARTQAKDHLIALFQLIDAADPRVVAARSALANALF